MSGLSCRRPCLFRTLVRPYPTLQCVHVSFGALLCCLLACCPAWSHGCSRESARIPCAWPPRALGVTPLREQHPDGGIAQNELHCRQAGVVVLFFSLKRVRLLTWVCVCGAAKRASGSPLFQTPCDSTRSSGRLPKVQREPGAPVFAMSIAWKRVRPSIVLFGDSITQESFMDSAYSPVSAWLPRNALCSGLVPQTVGAPDSRTRMHARQTSSTAVPRFVVSALGVPSRVYGH